jgi:uncharacterized protein (UPF0332 family)
MSLAPSTESRMKPGTDKLLERARGAVETAAAARAEGRDAAAAQRAYYAMLYAAKALLNERGLRFLSHARVAEALQIELRGESGLAAEQVQWLADAQRRREEMISDGLELTAGEADILLARARDFVRAAERRIGAD